MKSLSQVSSKYNIAIAVLIVNFKTARLVIDCILSLAEEKNQFPNLSIIVVDNDSQDDSVIQLENFVKDKQFSQWVKIISAPQNGGYAYGNNLAFDTAKGWLKKIDYFWMLNPDTRVQAGATAALVDFLRVNPSSVAGSCLQDADGTRQVSAFNFPSLISELCSGFGLGFFDKLFKKQIVCLPIPEADLQCSWLAGASLMFSSETQVILGDLDEKYFLYFEEVDYLLRARKKRVLCWYVPESRVIHEVGASTGISDVRKQQPRRPKYWFESRRRYFLKNHGRFYLFITDLLWTLAYSSWLIRSRLSDVDSYRARPPHFLSDFLAQSQLNPLNWFKGI